MGLGLGLGRAAKQVVVILLLHRISPVLCRFSAAGEHDLSAYSDDRLLKSACLWRSHVLRSFLGQ
jgi:hypothetical protein